jgi:hypothetical protein
MDDIVIRGGEILDGSGTDTVRGDLATRDGNIVTSPSATNAVSVGFMVGDLPSCCVSDLGASRGVARSLRPEGAAQPVP